MSPPTSSSGPIVNTIRPGNAHGNSITLPADLQRGNPDSSPTQVASYDGQATSDAVAPFSPLESGDSASDWEVASGAEFTPEQATGVESERSSLESAEPSSSQPDVSEPVESSTEASLPATVVERSEPTWSDIAATEHESETAGSSAPVEPAPAPAPAPVAFEPATTAEVYEAVGNLEGLRGWTVIPLAHFRSGSRNVVVAYPALNSSGRSVDALVIGVCLEQTSDVLVQCGDRWVVSDTATSTAALQTALGTSDYEVVSTQASAPLAELGPRLSALVDQYVAAVSNGDGASAERAATAFTSMLPVQRIAFNNDVAQVLWLAAEHGGRLVHVNTTRSGDTATMTFSVRRSFFSLQTITVTARRVPGTTDQWTVVDYR